ncbi:hypothetical protein HJG60_010240 [Phyllostomus discolor]|uniref:Uncharacterized protein n=1 Tax=Phyllostomus discolor TaxID=89673 RepID=A0A834EK61_9CHIR|nr:hypothetical protein HJG60_010240 [Phyllostomus discolor]
MDKKGTLRVIDRMVLKSGSASEAVGELKPNPRCLDATSEDVKRDLAILKSLSGDSWYANTDVDQVHILFINILKDECYAQVICCLLNFLNLLIMLLQLSHFFLPFSPLCPAPPLPPAFPYLSSCSWVVHISFLASTFLILFLLLPPPPVYFVLTIYAT